MFSEVVCFKCVRKRLCVGEGLWSDVIRVSLHYQAVVNPFLACRKLSIYPDVKRMLNTSPHVDALWRLWSRYFFKIWRQKGEIAHNEKLLTVRNCSQWEIANNEKLLTMRNCSFCYNVFNFTNHFGFRGILYFWLNVLKLNWICYVHVRTC